MKTLVWDVCGFQAKTEQGLTGHRHFKHQLAERYAHARKLAGSVELLTKEKTELEQLASTRAEQICQSWWQSFIQAGWIPPGTVQLAGSKFDDSRAVCHWLDPKSRQIILPA